MCHLWFSEEDSGDGDALSLPPGYAHPPLPHQRGVALGEAADEVMGAGLRDADRDRDVG